MSETTVYLSPNGQTQSEAEGPADTLVVATVEGLAVLRRAGPGAPWRLAQRSLTDRQIGQLVFEPGSRRLFAGAHADGGLWVSEHGPGGPWLALARGLDFPHLYALAVRRRGERVTLLAGTSPAALFRSDDLGDSFVELRDIQSLPGVEKWTFPPPPHIPHVKHIAFHPSQPETIFFAVEQGGLFRSTDDGRSWTELASYARDDDAAFKDVHRLLIHPLRHDEFFLATGEGLYRSTDAGATWVHVIRRDAELGYPDFLHIDPSEPDTVYTAGAARNPGGWFKTGRADSCVLRSTDGGSNWTRLGRGLPDPMVPAIEAMAAHAWPGGMMLAIGTATGEVYVSDDRGETWTCAIADLPPIARDEHHLPFAGRRAGSDQAHRLGWTPRRT